MLTCYPFVVLARIGTLDGNSARLDLDANNLTSLTCSRDARHTVSLLLGFTTVHHIFTGELKISLCTPTSTYNSLHYFVASTLASRKAKAEGRSQLLIAEHNFSRRFLSDRVVASTKNAIMVADNRCRSRTANCCAGFWAKLSDYLAERVCGMRDGSL